MSDADEKGKEQVKEKKDDERDFSEEEREILIDYERDPELQDIDRRFREINTDLAEFRDLFVTQMKELFTRLPEKEGSVGNSRKANKNSQTNSGSLNNESEQESSNGSSQKKKSERQPPIVQANSSGESSCTNGNAAGSQGNTSNSFSNANSNSFVDPKNNTKDQRINSFRKRVSIFDPNIDRPEHWVKRYEYLIQEYKLDIGIGIDELSRFMTHKEVTNWFVTEGSNCRSRFFDNPTLAREIWEDFSQSLIQFFGPNTTKEIALAKLKTYRLQPTQTADSFYMELRGLYSKAYNNFSDTDVVRHARDHLPESIKMEFIGVDGESQHAFLRKLRNLIAENRVVYDSAPSSSASPTFSAITANAAHVHHGSNDFRRNSVGAVSQPNQQSVDQVKCEYCGMSRHTVDRCYKKATDLLKERDEKNGNSRVNNHNNNSRGNYRGRGSFRGRGRGGRSYGRGNYQNNNGNNYSDSRRDDSHPRGNHNDHHNSDNNNDRHGSAMNTDDFRAFAASLQQMANSMGVNREENHSNSNNGNNGNSASREVSRSHNNSGK